MRYWLIPLLLWAEATLGAPTLPDFTATFTVTALGLDLGISRHTLHCRKGLCTYTADTRPQGLARLFTKEHFWEESRFSLTDTGIQWQYYQKKKFDAERLVRTYTLTRTDKGVLYEESKRLYPLRDNLFDALSLPLAISRYSHSGLPEKPVYLQDNNWQDRLTFTVRNRPQALETSEFSSLKTRFWQAEGEHVRVSAWLLPDAYNLPVRVEVLNKEKGKTITLQLDGHYRFTHASQ